MEDESIRQCELVVEEQNELFKAINTASTEHSVTRIVSLRMRNESVMVMCRSIEAANHKLAEERDALQRAMDERDKKPDPDAWQKRAEALWQILDDIDTSIDVIKPTSLTGYANFYNATVKRVEKRFKILTSDGHHLFIPDPAIFTDSTPPPAEGEYRDLIETLEAGHEGEAIDAIRTLTAQVAQLEGQAGIDDVAIKAQDKNYREMCKITAGLHATIADLRKELQHDTEWRDHLNDWIDEQPESISGYKLDVIKHIVASLREQVAQQDRNRIDSDEAYHELYTQRDKYKEQLATAERERDEAVVRGLELVEINGKHYKKHLDELATSQADTARLRNLIRKLANILDQNEGLSVEEMRELHDAGEGAATAATNEQQADAGAGGEGAPPLCIECGERLVPSKPDGVAWMCDWIKCKKQGQIQWIAAPTPGAGEKVEPGSVAERIEAVLRADVDTFLTCDCDRSGFYFFKGGADEKFGTVMATLEAAEAMQAKEAGGDDAGGRSEPNAPTTIPFSDASTDRSEG